MSDYRYEPQTIEEKWQRIWAEENLYQTLEQNQKPKYYVLGMFPYPSGRLHMGHVRNYTIPDVISRVRRMQGYQVLHPMGWDAFGLPAENAAIDRGVHPAKWTYQNIDQMRDQLKRLGISIDWSREIATCSPEYYKWTQWIFLQFFEAGLAYQKESAVNWDPVDQTVLANEQVDSEGRSWRSGAKVERKMLRQWFLKITAYAEQLLSDINKLDGWPDRVKVMQENWIGKSVGAIIEFEASGEKVPIFTTRPETVWGATFIVLSPEHPLVAKLTAPEQVNTVSQYQLQAASKSEIERTSEDRKKTGIFIGSYATNPVNGKQIPIWVADYVLMDYGTGAIMAVPAHDQRDFDFAQEFGLEIIQVVFTPDETPEKSSPLKKAYTSSQSGVLYNSGFLDGLLIADAKHAAISYIEEKGFGQAQVTYRLRDWLISRQRYWGCPIPIIYCPKCGVVSVPESNLPVVLPEDVEFTGRGASPLTKSESWLNIPCPTCGSPARRETDTMDTFIDSSWYFLRYCDAHNQQKVFDSTKANHWMPVDQYVGGIEHAILHLLYSRFFTKFLRDQKLLNFDEPFQRLLTQGMVQGVTYKNPKTGKYFPPSDVNREDPRDPESGDSLEIFYEKMSKSKYNGVDPEEVLARYGADTARMFILFKAPPEKDLEWDDADVEGQFRFLNRVWKLVLDCSNSGLNSPQLDEKQDNLGKPEKELLKAIHTAIQAIGDDVDGNYQFNTAISELMKLCNALTDFSHKESRIYKEGIETLVLLLAPFAPHIAEELWQMMGYDESIHKHPWPKANPELLIADEVTLVIQIMGKTRGTVQVPAKANSEELEQYARSSEVAQRYLDGKEIKKVIVVPGKLVNFVTVN